MPSESYLSILNILDGQLTLPEDDLATAKAKMEALHGHPIDQDTQAEWLDFGGVHCALVTASCVTDTERYLLYFRGGAFIAADGNGFLFYAEMLSRQLNAKVIMVSYRLAPQHPFPAALDDCCNVYRGLLANGIQPSTIGFIGDSCGGGLVLTTLLKLRDLGVELPACGISLSGWFDMESNTQEKDPLYHQAYCHQRGLNYAGVEPLTNPLISPVFAKFHDLPPLLLQTGAVDPTATQAQRIYQLGQETNTPITLDTSDDMIHGFQGFANLGVPESLDALARAKLFFVKNTARLVKT